MHKRLWKLIMKKPKRIVLMMRFLMILKNSELILMRQIYSVQKPKPQVQMNFYLLTMRKKKMILRYQHS